MEGRKTSWGPEAARILPASNLPSKWVSVSSGKTEDLKPSVTGGQGTNVHIIVKGLFSAHSHTPAC